MKIDGMTLHYTNYLDGKLKAALEKLPEEFIRTPRKYLEAHDTGNGNCRICPVKGKRLYLGVIKRKIPGRMNLAMGVNFLVFAIEDGNYGDYSYIFYKEHQDFSKTN